PAAATETTEAAPTTAAEPSTAPPPPTAAPTSAAERDEDRHAPSAATTPEQRKDDEQDDQEHDGIDPAAALDGYRPTARRCIGRSVERRVEREPEFLRVALSDAQRHELDSPTVVALRE